MKIKNGFTILKVLIVTIAVLVFFVPEVLGFLQCCGSPYPSVTLYQHSNYGGNSKSFYYSVPWVGSDFNDVTSSLKVPPGYKVTLYENSNYGGRSKTYYASTPWVDYDFNDIVSSFTMTRI